MGVFSGPEINEDGLVFAVDAANTKSYPSSGGTTWYDLSGQGKSGTIDGATHNSDGYFTFDGTDDYVNFRADLNGPNLTLSTITASAWVNFDTATWVMGNGGQFRIRLQGTKVGFWIRELGDGSINELQSSTSTMSTGEWGNIVGTYDGTDQKIYHNGVEVATTNPGLGFLDEGSNNLALGRSFFNSTHFFDGKLSVASIYNRALTAAEVAQNFNALRGRFGI